MRDDLIARLKEKLPLAIIGARKWDTLLTLTPDEAEAVLTALTAQGTAANPFQGQIVPGSLKVLGRAATDDEIAALTAQGETAPAVFQSGAVVLHSGGTSDFKIDCEALTAADLATLAKQAARTLPTFGAVEGVPTGGVRFAAAMRRHAADSPLLLIVDDVLTTGASMEAQRAGRDAVGLVLFARGPLPSWVRACFTLTLGETAPAPATGADWDRIDATTGVPAAASPLPAAEVVEREIARLQTKLRDAAEHEAGLWFRDWAGLSGEDAQACLSARLVFIQEQAIVFAAALTAQGETALFQSGTVTLHSGGTSDFKIDCDGLTDADLAALSAQAVKVLPPFGAIEGVPHGGLRFAAALRPYQTLGGLLIVDDVLTTGASMETKRAGRGAMGLVLFARGPCPVWVRACFTLTLGGIALGETAPAPIDDECPNCEHTVRVEHERDALEARVRELESAAAASPLPAAEGLADKFADLAAAYCAGCSRKQPMTCYNMHGTQTGRLVSNLSCAATPIREAWKACGGDYMTDWSLAALRAVAEGR